ncbi:VENN motif pre-toxin domain-containing protein [Mangrovibacter sp. SLW1]
MHALIFRGITPVLARLVKDVTEGHDSARVALHTLVSAALAKAQGGNAVAGGVGGLISSVSAKGLAKALYNKDAEELTSEEKSVVTTLVTALASAGGSVASGDTRGMVSAGNAARVEVENNSLAGDKARQSVKESAEWWKKQIRDKLGEGTTSAIANGIINEIVDSGDSAIGSADYVADAAMALASCAAGDSYCNKALSDLSGKNQAVADSVKALMKSETWSAVADTVKQAAGGNQAALEATGGMLAGIMLPGKKVPDALAIQTISNSVVDAKKFDYLFGRASGNAHTLDRTNQLSLEMKRLGITDDISGHAMLAEHFTAATKDSSNIVKKYTDQYGSFEVRESFFIGPSGKATMFESTFEITADGSHRFITTIPKNGVTK